MKSEAVVIPLTDKELNESVAKALGWTKHEHPIYENGEIVQAVGWVKSEPIKPCFHEGLPDYCNDIAAAWKIVEYISSKLDPTIEGNSVGHGFKLEHHTENTEEKWLCTLPEIVSAPPYEEMNEDVIAEDDTAGRAVCRAFLKYVQNVA